MDKELLMAYAQCGDEENRMAMARNIAECYAAMETAVNRQAEVCQQLIDAVTLLHRRVADLERVRVPR